MGLRGTRQQGSREDYIIRSLDASPNIIWVIKSRRMRWVGFVAHMRKTGELHTRFWWQNLMERDHLEDPGIDWRLI